MIRMARLRAIARKEWIQLRRDTRSLILAFALPLFLLIFFGYAITWDVDDIRLAVLDRDLSRDSRALVERFTASGYFELQRHIDSYGEAESLLATGEALAVLVIPPDFSRRLREGAGGGVPVQLLLDGSDANTATIAQGYADAIVTRYGMEARLSGRPRPATLEPEVRIWYNADLKSTDMIVPSLVAVIMSIIAAMLTALTIAREWERGTMEQLASTPVTELEVVLGKLLPYLLIGMLDVAVTVGAGIAIFGTPFRGSVVLLGVLTLLFLAGAPGLGIIISAAVKAQVLAIQIAMVATYLPAVLLSGFLFDIASMPGPLQLVTYLVPARYYVTVTRGIFLKGVGVEAMLPQAILMLAFAVIGVGLATRVFRKELA